jgi:hypothetical protein
MPLIRDPFMPKGMYIGLHPSDEPEPSLMEGVGAALRYEGTIGGAISSAQNDYTSDELNRVDPNYNPFAPDEIRGYEEFADRFIDSNNPLKTRVIKQDIDRNRKDDETLSAMGWTGVGLRVGASLLDPTILIPGGALVRSGAIGYKIGRSALKVGALAGAAVTTQEAILSSVNPGRTDQESIMAIGGSVVLGALLGAAGAKFFSKGEWGRLARGIEDDLAGEVENPGKIAETIVARMQSAGAAAVDDIKLDDLGVGGGRAAQAVAKATAALRINPGVETMFSPSVKVREAYAKMVDNSVYTQMNMEGKSLGPDVENLVKVYQRGAMSQWMRSARTAYKQAKGEGFQGSRSDFMVRVARAGRRGDVDELGDPHVTRAAQEARAKIFDPLLERAKAAGLLPEDVRVTTAASYVTRLWNRQRLIGEEPRFKQIAREYFQSELNKVPADKRPDFVSKADMDAYVDDVVDSVFNNLTGRGAGDLPEWLVPLARGPLKERTFNIPDELVEDFLENDMEMILRRYTRTMAADVELTEKFGRADMKDTLDAIRKEYDDLAKQAKTPEARAKLNTQRDRDLNNLQAFRDMIRGTYRQAEESNVWGRITRGALAWNYMRLLGGVVMSSLTDIARPLAVHGMAATMREGLPALVSGLRSVRIARQDARDLGAVTEAVMNSRLASLAELQDPYRYGSKYERFLSNSTRVFTKLTGLPYWNDTMKTIASVMTQNRMAKTALNWAKASERDRAYLAYLGIDENMAEQIAEQIRKHGVEEGGIWGANVRAWDDDYLRRVWGAALNKDVDRTIVTKGAADQPLWTRSNWGKLIMQFKSFGMASHQKVLLSGLQESPLRLAQSMAVATPLGMMVAYLKYMERGDTDEAERLMNNPGLWIADGLDRTGILSIPFEISNTAEKLGSPVGIVSGAQAIAGDEDRGGKASRYASRNKLGAVLGPSAGILEDLTTIASQLASGDLQKSGANAMIRQLPGATLPGVRTGLHTWVKPALQEAVD